MPSPWPGPTATATRPSVAMRRSASSAPRPATAPGRMSTTSGAVSILASSGMPATLAVTGDLLTVTGNLARPAQVPVVVNLHPIHGANGRRRDLAAAVRELLIAVLVVQPGVP